MPGAERGDPAPRFFLDTNILVYSFSGQDAAKRETSRALACGAGACVSTQVLSELAHVLTRKFKVSAEEVRVRVSSIASSCEVITVTAAIVLDALRIVQRYGYGFFDSQIIAAALAADASKLYSEDLHDGQKIDGALTIRSPFRQALEQTGAAYRARRARKRHG